MAALARGSDVLTCLPTGSGKSLNFFVPAVARWLEGVVAGDVLPPLAVVVVPWRALCFDQEREANAFLLELFEKKLTPILGSAVFVDRGRKAATPPLPPSTPVRLEE